MKIKRQKQAKRTISFYKYNFSFREPFQVLIDGTFCQAALIGKIQIKEQLPKYLMGEVALCTTSCALKEVETLGKDLYGAKLILQKFQIRRCPHFEEPVSASECILSMLEGTNPHHYFIATQDNRLTKSLKEIPGVPVMYIIQNTMVLDKPSDCSVKRVEAVLAGEMLPTSQQHSIDKLKEEQLGVGEEGADEANRRKRKRKSGNPNPLSCLKKKKKGPTQQPTKSAGSGDGESNRKKRTRHHRKRKHAALGAGAGQTGSATTNPVKS